MGDYLRVVAGFFAAVFWWTGTKNLVGGDVGAGVAGLLMGAGLWYLAVGVPLRRWRKRVVAEEEELADRADAGHAAFLAGAPDPFLVPPPRTDLRPHLQRGVKIAIVIAACLFVIGVVNDVADGDTEALRPAVVHIT